MCICPGCVCRGARPAVACLAPAVSAAVSALEARQQVAPLAAARQALLADLRPDVQTTVVRACTALAWRLHGYRNPRPGRRARRHVPLRPQAPRYMRP